MDLVEEGSHEWSKRYADDGELQVYTPGHNHGASWEKSSEELFDNPFILEHYPRAPAKQHIPYRNPETAPKARCYWRHWKMKLCFYHD